MESIYEQSKRIATQEFNAAVEGLLEAGVEDILMLDGHGPGAVSFEDLHPAAKLLHGRPAAPRAVRDPILADYDACVMIGQHAMAGMRKSNQNHTQNGRTIDYYKLNGGLIGEIAQFALYNGALGLPLFFLSGEDLACREAEKLISGVSTAPVKTGLGRSQAISVSAEEAHRRIREGISRAVEQQRNNPIDPLEWHGPFELEKRFFLLTMRTPLQTCPAQNVWTIRRSGSDRIAFKTSSTYRASKSDFQVALGSTRITCHPIKALWFGTILVAMPPSTLASKDNAQDSNLLLASLDRDSIGQSAAAGWDLGPVSRLQWEIRPAVRHPHRPDGHIIPILLATSLSDISY